MSNGSLSSDAPAARLCHILKWEDFDGYGFNLHAEKGKLGQYIGKVDEGSPAEAAGLKQGDRIVEVNGVNISNENHKQVVQRIKAVPDETQLLVVDAEADNYYKSKSIIIKNSLPNVVHLKSPEHSRDSGFSVDRDSEDTRSQKSERSSAFAENELNGEKTSSYKGSSGATTPLSERKRSLGSSPEPQHIESPSPVEESPDPPSSNDSLSPGLNLNMTAAELRAQLAARKKFDPKKENIDLRRKFDIIQTL